MLLSRDKHCRSNICTAYSSCSYDFSGWHDLFLALVLLEMALAPQPLTQTMVATATMAPMLQSQPVMTAFAPQPTFVMAPAAAMPAQLAPVAPALVAAQVPIPVAADPTPVLPVVEKEEEEKKPLCCVAS